MPGLQSPLGHGLHRELPGVTGLNWDPSKSEPSDPLCGARQVAKQISNRGDSSQTDSDAEAAPHHATVAHHSPSQSRWTAQKAALEFGRLQMLPRWRQLIDGGAPVKLGTRAFDLLTVLLQADGSLVAKEELVSCVWPSLHVSEENLKVQISALRKAFGEDRDFTRTELGRGCRFTAAVKATAPWNSSWHAARPWRRPRRGTVSRWMSIRFFPECSHQSASGSRVAKSRLCKALALAVALGLSTFFNTVQAAPAGGSGTVRGLYKALLSTMKSGRTLGGSGRFAQLAPVIRSSFDVALMARCRSALPGPA